MIDPLIHEVNREQLQQLIDGLQELQENRCDAVRLINDDDLEPEVVIRRTPEYNQELKSLSMG